MLERMDPRNRRVEGGERLSFDDNISSADDVVSGKEP
jgi:hypothetical protein